MTQKKGKAELTNWEIVSVNPNDKKWDWKDLFCFWGNSVQSIVGFSLIASLYIVYELNFFIVLLGSLIGSLLVYWFVNLVGKPSQKHGIPFSVFLRISLGFNGARYVSLLRGLVGIFMFGVQTFFLSKSFGYLIRIFLYSIDATLQEQDLFLIFILGLNAIDWIAFIFAILLQIFLFNNGHRFNRLFINFSAIFVYIGLIAFLFIVAFQNYSTLLQSFKELIIFENIFTTNAIGPLLTVTGTIFAYFSIVIVNFGDFSRYVKNENELKKGNLSLILNLIIFSLFSVLLVVGSDIILSENLNQTEKIFTNPMDIIGKFENLFLTIVVLFFILFASAATNLIANYIPSQNILLNFFPKSLTIKKVSFIIGFLGFFIGIYWLPLLSQIGILSFVDTLSAFFGPIFGIIIMDYYVLKNKQIVNKDIFSSMPGSSYYYSNGWHIKGIYALIIGFIFSSATIWNIDLRFLHSFSWIIGAFMSSVIYYLLTVR